MKFGTIGFSLMFSSLMTRGWLPTRHHAEPGNDLMKQLDNQHARPVWNEDSAKAMRTALTT